MQEKLIILDFGSFILEAMLFESPIVSRFLENLPYTIKLTGWGNELYGSIGIDLGEDNPVTIISPGGIAYTNNGNYLCIFFGQNPAWPVEYIGRIMGDTWKRLIEGPVSNSVTIRFKRSQL